MVRILVLCISIAAIVTTFFSIFWGWVILAVPSIFLLITLFSLKQKRWKYIPELSEEANRMLQKFGHYYSMPSAGNEFSSSASALMFCGAAIGIICAFKGFWYGFGIGVAYWFLMVVISRSFNPTNFLTNNFELTAHEEITSWIIDKVNSKVGN